MRMQQLLQSAALIMAVSATRIEVYPLASCPHDAQNGSTPTFCSLPAAADWISQHGGGSTNVCLHPGQHTLQQPLRLNESHSGTVWATCAAAAPTISGGLLVPTASWQREAGGLWAATLPAGANVQHLRTLWVGGARANRIVLNASALLGDLRVTPAGYVSQRPIPWQATAESVELNYFQQMAPWQEQRCVLVGAVDHTLTVSQPCFATISQRASGIPGLPRNKSSGRTGCADSNPECDLEGNPLGSGLPMFVEHLPLTDPAIPEEAQIAGQFSFSARQQKVWYRPHPWEVSVDGLSFTAEVIAPISEGLIAAVGLRDNSFSGLNFEYMAWNSASLPAGFIDNQDGITDLGYIPGAFDCVNCTNAVVADCTFSKMGGSGVMFSGVTQHVRLRGLDVYDVSGNGIHIGSLGNVSWPYQCVDNQVTDCQVSRCGQEYTGAVGICAEFNAGLVISHNTVKDLPYGAISVGAGAARAGYARNNTVSHNKIANFMLRMQDSAAVYVTGRQPGSRIYRNFISEQGLTGLEPPPICDRSGQRCTMDEVIAYEDLWINQVDPTGHKYNIKRCNRTAEGWCNQTGNAHGGGIYTDNGSGGWTVTENVLADVFHWMFTWQAGRMVDMRFEHNWVDSPLFTNNAGDSVPPVRVVANTLVARSGAWPAAARAVMAAAGAQAREHRLGQVHGT